jgi:hypothetical protein
MPIVLLIKITSCKYVPDISVGSVVYAIVAKNFVIFAKIKK